MLVARCPQCGKPSPLSLAQPEQLRCAACGYAGPPPAPVSEGLRQAGAALQGLDRSQRQLSAFQRQVLTSASRRTLLVLATAAAISLPLGLCALPATSSLLSGRAVTGGAVVSWLVCVAPLALVVVFAAIASQLLGRRLAPLRARIAATPPARPGEPAGCHFCGGPVSTQGAEPVATCGFCGADNLVAAGVVAARADLAVADVADYAQAIQRQHGAVLEVARAAQRQLVVGGVVAVLLGWGLGGCLGCAFTMLVFDREAAVEPDAEYAFVDTEDGRCLGVVHRDDGVVEVDRGSEGSVTLSGPEARALETLSAEDLVGRRLVERRPAGFSDRVGRLTRPVGTVGGDVDFELEGDDGETHRVHTVGRLCEPR